MSTTESRLVIPGRVVPAGEGVAWIGEGWRLFLKAPLMWILSLLVSLVIFIILGLLPIVGSLAAFILKAILLAGFMVACRSLSTGGEFEIEHLFAGFRTQLANLVIMAIVVLACLLAILAITVGFIAVTIGIAAFTSGSEDFMAVLAGSAVFLLAASLLMLALLVPLAMAYWFAPALIVLDGVGPMAALKASFVASLRNFVPFLLYGLVMAVLAIVAAIPFGLGFLAWVPVAIASTYAAYRSIFTTPVAPPAV